MKPILVPMLASVALSGCGIDQMIRDDDPQASRAKCAEYGFKPGSVEFENCMQRSVETTERERGRSNREMQRRLDEKESREKK